MLLDAKSKLPATYAAIYSACRAVVCEAKRGEGLYDNLKLSLEQCAGRIATYLLSLDAPPVEWLVPFVEQCEWFAKQVVSDSRFLCPWETLTIK